MADRVKYFLLGLLFLVVAGVIAFDRWNSRESLGPGPESARADEDEGKLWFSPAEREEEPRVEEERVAERPERGRSMRIDPNPEPEPPRPEPTPPPRPAPEPEPADDRIHVVESGDTLGEIAARYYPGRVQEGIRLIAKANGISNPNHISIDDKLVIPASASSAGARKPIVERKPATERKRGIPSSYTVKSGDGNLYQILRKFYGRAGEGARVVKVMEMNDLISTRVPAGTVLKLPKK